MEGCTGGLADKEVFISSKQIEIHVLILEKDSEIWLLLYCYQLLSQNFLL